MESSARRSPSPDLKRGVDLGLALAGLVLASPILALAWAAIRLGSPGPAIFRQERSGRWGRPFDVIKFRTMAGPPRVEPGRETSSDDLRITRVGRFLRRTGIDELPQLINVVRGEMSLVGPRPLLAWENARCDPRQARRLDARPGITGLSQVSGRNAIPWADRIEWDLAYLDRASFGLDLAILLRTIPVALFGLDAYAAGPLPFPPATSPKILRVDAGSVDRAYPAPRSATRSKKSRSGPIEASIP